MDIYHYLQRDHNKVSDLMERVLITKNTQERKSLFKQIKEELTLHADTEEATFYRAIEDATRSKQVHEKMEHADKEHNEIREYLEKLSTTSVDSEQWLELFGEFKHSVMHHVEEEEEDIFEKAKKYLSKAEAVKLAKDMEQLKQQHKKELFAA